MLIAAKLLVFVTHPLAWVAALMLWALVLLNCRTTVASWCSAAGWNVTPYAVDFAAGNHTPWTAYSLLQGARKWVLVLHECVGLLVYQATGRA
ncbi:MAG: hypothetical protein ACKOWD_15960 [Rhodoferax sp.]